MAYDWNSDLNDTDEQDSPAAPVVPNNAEYLPDPPEPVELDEVEYRLQKAIFYKMLLGHNLISSDSEEAIEVEQEIQDFVRERLAILVGIKPERDDKPNLPFTDEEIEALKAVAAKVLHKPGIVQARTVEPKAAPTIVPVAETKPPAVRPAQPAPAPVRPAAPAPVLDKPRRPRGRPRKNTTPAPTMTKTEIKAAPKKDDNLKPGERIEEVGGKRYKVVQRVVNDPATGKPVMENGRVKTLEHRVDISPKVAPTTPMPPQEQINMMEAANAIQILQSNPLAAGLIPTAMTLPDTTQKD